MKRFLMVLAASAALLVAQPKAGALKDYLGLSDTQASALQQIRQSARKDLEPLRQVVQSKAKALREATRAGSADANALGQMVIDLREARKQLEPIRTRAHDQAMAVLTPDQKAKLDQLKANAKQRRELRQAARLGLVEVSDGNRQNARRPRSLLR